MIHLKETPTFLKRVFTVLAYHIPSKKDNMLQSVLKIFFILSLSAAIIVTSLFVGYFTHGKTQRKIMGETEKIWNTAVTKNDESVYDAFKKQNGDPNIQAV